jgi:hypothetical protein
MKNDLRFCFYRTGYLFSEDIHNEDEKNISSENR